MAYEDIPGEWFAEVAEKIAYHSAEIQDIRIRIKKPGGKLTTVGRCGPTEWMHALSDIDEHLTVGTRVLIELLSGERKSIDSKSHTIKESIMPEEVKGEWSTAENRRDANIAMAKSMGDARIADSLTRLIESQSKHQKELVNSVLDRMSAMLERSEKREEDARTFAAKSLEALRAIELEHTVTVAVLEAADDSREDEEKMALLREGLQTAREIFKVKGAEAKQDAEKEAEKQAVPEQPPPPPPPPPVE